MSGQTLDAMTKEGLKEGWIAGVILMKPQLKSMIQVRRLTDSIRQAASSGKQPIPIICVDQEGGRVDRLRELPGFSPEPSAAKQGHWSTQKIEGVSLDVAKQMISLGINVDLGPDLDLAKGKGIVGDRSFGLDPSNVIRSGGAVIRGFHRAGIAAVVKHFPGHGLTPKDSHLTLPVAKVSGAVLERHASVFRSIIPADPDAVLVAHLLVPSIDRQYPASLSKSILTQLREVIGPNRLILTDDGTMGALTRFGSETHRAALALRSGADIYLTTTTIQGLGKKFRAKVRQFVGSDSALATAAHRVNLWRKQLN